MTETGKNTEVRSRRRAWLWLSLLVALVGIGFSIYSINHHLEVRASGATEAICNINQTFSCDDVAQSSYSEVAGIPLGVWGLAYFLAAALLTAVGLSRTKYAFAHLQGYAGLVLIGVIVAIGLGTLSIVQIGAVCLTCIAIYTLTLTQAGLLFIYRKELSGGIQTQPMFQGGLTAIAIVIVTIGFYHFLGFGEDQPISLTSSSSVQPDSSSVRPNSSAGVQSNLLPNAVELPLALSPYSGAGEDYRKGSDQAKVTIVEFADFQCPGCRQMASNLGILADEFGDDVRLVFRNYPLDKNCNSGMSRQLHDFACEAAILSRCAGQYGRFWPFHDLVFANQSSINSAKLRSLATTIGLSEAQIDTCLASKDHLAKVKDDIEVARKVGVDSTPTVFFNGRKLVTGRSLEEMRSLIKSLIAEQ